MDPAVTRSASGVLVLLACAITTWIGPDRTPTRMVTETVSVVHVWPRKDAKAAAELAKAEPAAPAPETIAVQPASPKHSPPGRAPSVAARAHVQHAKAVPQEEPAVARPVKAAVAVPIVKASCRPPACRVAARATNAVRKQAAAYHAPKAQPPLPAVFVPIRNLGLYIQTRMAAPRDGKAAPAKRTR